MLLPAEYIAPYGAHIPCPADPTMESSQAGSRLRQLRIENAVPVSFACATFKNWECSVSQHTKSRYTFSVSYVEALFMQ